MTEDALNKKRPVALLDVDQTLTFEFANGITYNDNLIETLLASGVKDVYLFTSMKNNEDEIKDRLLLIEHLKNKGLTVHGVISTSDLIWHQKKLASQFYGELYEIVVKSSLNNRTEIDGAAQKLLADPKYAALQNFDQAEAGVAFKEGQSAPSQMEEATNMVNMVGVIRTFIKDPYRSEKGELLKAFLKNKPEWVSSVVVADDADDNISAVQEAATEFPEVSVATVHNLKKTQGYDGQINDVKNLTKPDYYQRFQPIAQGNLLKELDDYRNRREDVAHEYKYRLFCMGLGYSKTQKLEAVDALSAAIRDPNNAKPITDEQLATLRNGDLGKTIRSFVKAGGADIILGANYPITTVRDFVQALNGLIPQQDSQLRL